MKNNRHPGRVLAALILSLGTLCTAHAGRYQVELLLFLNGGRDATEALPEQTPGPNTAGALLLQRPGAPSITLLNRNERRLGPQHYTLNRSARYQLLLHEVWRQPINSESRTPRLYFQLPPPASAAGPDPLAPPPRLAGTLQMSRGRYLHADLDVVYREPLPRGAEGIASPALRSYRLHQKRRMRSRELHYLDHPALGALILVNPVATAPAAETPPAGASETAPAEAPGGMAAGQEAPAGDAGRTEAPEPPAAR